jgi:hypothetical protein
MRAVEDMKQVILKLKEQILNNIFLPMLAICMGLVANMEIEVSDRIRVVINDARMMGEKLSAIESESFDDLELRSSIMLDRLLATQGHLNSMSIWHMGGAIVITIIYLLAVNCSWKHKAVTSGLVILLLLQIIARDIS